MQQNICFQSSKEFKNKPTDWKILKDMTHNQGCLFVYSTLIELSTFSVKLIRLLDAEFVFKLDTQSQIAKWLTFILLRIPADINS